MDYAAMTTSASAALVLIDLAWSAIDNGLVTIDCWQRDQVSNFIPGKAKQVDCWSVTAAMSGSALRLGTHLGASSQCV